MKTEADKATKGLDAVKRLQPLYAQMDSIKSDLESISTNLTKHKASIENNNFIPYSGVLVKELDAKKEKVDAALKAL